jgi:hypothetical protein
MMEYALRVVNKIRHETILMKKVCDDQENKIV